MCSYLPMKGWWYSESEVGRVRPEWSGQRDWQNSCFSGGRVDTLHTQLCHTTSLFLLAGQLLLGPLAEVMWAIYPSPFQKHAKSKQSYKAVLSITRMEWTGMAESPSGWQCSYKVETLPHFAGPVLPMSLVFCAGISNRMDYLMYESIALDSDFTSYLYQLLAGDLGWHLRASFLNYKIAGLSIYSLGEPLVHGFVWNKC